MAPSGRVTIADVAAASGVGVGTVSRVINGGENVRESTRRSVLTVIKQLGYRPSYLAASLSRGTPRTVAIVLPRLTTPSAVMRLAGALAPHQRRRGYREALRQAGIGCDAGVVRRGPHGAANAEALAAELLALPDPPSAIFAASDTQAMGVLAAADRAGRPVPGELSVIGFDDIESAVLLGLSTVRQPLEDSGAEAARRLCALLRGAPIGPLLQPLPLRVVARSSTARLRESGPLQDDAYVPNVTRVGAGAPGST